MWLQFLLIAAIPAVGLPAPGWPKDWTVALAAAGLGLMLLAVIVALLAAGALGPSFSVNPHPHESATMVSRGIYRRARHPMYGAVILAGIGAALLLSPWALVPAALLALELDAKSRVEERALRGRFPGYTEYETAVRRRFFPL